MIPIDIDAIRRGLNPTRSLAESQMRQRAAVEDPLNALGRAAASKPPLNTGMAAPITPPSMGMVPRASRPAYLANQGIDMMEGASSVTPGYVPPPASPTPAPASIVPEMALNRADVDVPALPGTSGYTTPYSRKEAARYDYVKNHANSENTKGVWGHIKSGLRSALPGFLQGLQQGGNLQSGLGGAAGAGLVGGINPTAGRSYEFDVFHGARMDREDQLAQVQRDQELQNQYRLAQIQDLTGRGDERRANIRRIEAQAEAARTGRPQVQDIEDENGVVRKIAFWPDGRMVDMGPSGTAAVKRDDRESRERMGADRIESSEKIAEGRNRTSEANNKRTNATRLTAVGMQQGGANSRAAMLERGRQGRFDERYGTVGGDAAKTPAPPPARRVSRARAQAYADQYFNGDLNAAARAMRQEGVEIQ